MGPLLVILSAPFTSNLAHLCQATKQVYDKIDVQAIYLEVKPMDIKPIKTDADYHAALEEIETLMMAEPDSSEGEKLDVLVTLVEAYEAKHYPLDLPDPVEAIKFEMERQRSDCQRSRADDRQEQSRL